MKADYKSPKGEIYYKKKSKSKQSTILDYSETHAISKK